jgi:hypothetical protein
MRKEGEQLKLSFRKPVVMAFAALTMLMLAVAPAHATTLTVMPGVTGLVVAAVRCYAGVMRYPDGGGLTAAERARREHQQLAGPLVLVWDNLNTHISAAMAELAAARDWLTVFQLPAYAHELNPVEPLWSHLKRSLANLVKRNLAQLTALVRTRLKRMQYRPALLGGFLASTGLDLAPFL